MAGSLGDLLMSDVNQVDALRRQNNAQVWAGDQAALQRSWAEQMSNTQWQRAVADIRASGLNPALAYGHGGAGVPSGASASSGIASPAGTPRFGNPFLDASTVQVNSAVAQKTEAEAGVARASEAEIRARTPTYGVQMDKLRQDIQESVQRIDTFKAQAGAYTASAAHATQQVENLRAMLPQIQATVDQLHSVVRLNDAQVKELAVRMSKSAEEIREIQQRVQANLPAAERGLADLKIRVQQLEYPRQVMENAPYTQGHPASAIGALGVALRTLLPILGGIIK